jgi:DNA-binding LytR/AlgR family response regulator
MIPTAIIVDDETSLIDYLGEKLQQLWPALQILGTAQNGRQALELVNQTQPDIIFLDIHMPGLSGLQVASQLPLDIQIVFITAYNDHAVEAFEHAAVDYILKPVSEKRLLHTIDRLQSNSNSSRNEILSALQSLQGHSKNYLHWLRAGYDETTELVSVDDVVYFKAEYKYTSVITQRKEYVLRRTIKDLEGELDPSLFWRVHRSIIVRVDQIASAKRDLRGRYTIALRDRSESIRTSQSYGHLFKQM